MNWGVLWLIANSLGVQVDRERLPDKPGKICMMDHEANGRGDRHKSETQKESGSESVLFIVLSLGSTNSLYAMYFFGLL